MAIDEHTPLDTPKKLSEQPAPESVPRPPSESDNASAAFDDTAYRDNIDFDFGFEEDGIEAESSIWRDRATREAFLKAREDYEKFELALRADKRRRAFEATSDPFPPTTKVAAREVQQKWFLVLENRLENDPFLGIDSLPPDEEPPDGMLVRSLPSVQPDPGPHEAAGDVQGNTIEKLKLRSTFPSVATGHYTMYLRVKQDSQEKITQEKATARFLVRVVVRYTKTRMTDVYYLRFFKSDKDGSDAWYYLKASGQFEIRAHHETAQVNVRIVQDENFNRSQRARLCIRSLELVPVEMTPMYQEPIFSHIGHPDITIATQPLNIGGLQDPKTSQVLDSLPDEVDLDDAATKAVSRGELGVVSRVVTSKVADFFAVLTVFSEHVVVQAWRKGDVERTNHNEPAEQDVSRLGAISEFIPCKDARNLSLELEISPSGEHIAIFQPPKAGDWQVGDTLPTSELGVCFFRNPLATLTKDVAVMVNEEDQVGHRLERFESIPSSLQSAVGYAAFVDGIPTTKHPVSTKLVFCDGLYLEVFDVYSDSLAHSHTISLASKASGLCRTIACEMMMSSITSNMFIWIEEDGRHCSTWDLKNGSAVGRFEISRRQRMTLTGLTALKFARSQNIVAIAGFDNSITTLDAYSGMEISRRQFKHQIEHITFPSPQSQILVVMLRHEEENEQRVMIFDPLQLDIKGLAQNGPPLSRSTVFDIFGPKSWLGLGDICRPDGHLVHFYTSKTPTQPANAPKPSAVETVSDDCPYTLRITAPRYSRKGGGGQESCRRQVEIWRKGDPATCVFSFIPEPWEQDTPACGIILPTGDRFVVHSSWTIQLWSLPSDEEPRCKLIFFWSALGDTRGHKIISKPDVEAILDSHVQFGSMSCKETAADNGQTRFQAIVVFPEQKPIRVLIPNSPVRVDDFQNITEHCIRSIHLLALTHTVVSSEYRDVEAIQQEGSSVEDHTWAITNFVIDHINHSIHPYRMEPTFYTALQAPEGPDVSVLAHLLQDPCPNDISAKFIASLLESSYCNWIPRKDVALGPLEMAIDRRNTAAVGAILDYCTEKASTLHPAYMNAVERSLGKLQRYYPELLRSTLRNASYIPARRDDFCEDWVNMASFGRPVIRRPGSSRLNFFRRQFRDPIATFQLPTSRVAHNSNRLTQFEQIPEPMPVLLEYEYSWYVVPFPSLIKLGPESQFCKMAGENFFDNPALMSILRYKTWHYGIFYWMARYIFLLLYYGIFTAVITAQLYGDGWVKDLLGDNWLVLVIVGLAIGSYLLVLEVVQLRYVGVEYFKSFYNYIDVGSLILTITCLAHTISTQWPTPDTSVLVLEQFGPTSFAILAMYLHVIAETRIFRRVGTIVNIIVQIIQKIWDFFIVFALVVAGFNHAFVYFFHAYRTDLEETNFPKGAWASFTTTFFFLAGRYDTVNDDFEGNPDSRFLTLILFFHLFTSIVMLTVLIALMTDAFSTTREEGEQAWRMQLSEALAEAEMTGGFLLGIAKMVRMHRWVPFIKRALSFRWRRIQHSPTYIYYAARIQDAEAYKEKIRQGNVVDEEDTE